MHVNRTKAVPSGAASVVTSNLLQLGFALVCTGLSYELRTLVAEVRKLTCTRARVPDTHGSPAGVRNQALALKARPGDAGRSWNGPDHQSLVRVPVYTHSPFPVRPAVPVQTAPAKPTYAGCQNPESGKVPFGALSSKAGSLKSSCAWIRAWKPVTDHGHATRITSPRQTRR